MTSRLPDAYFDTMYGASADPWDLRTRWYERRKYAITLSMLAHRRYRHAFEPGCSIGTLTERLTERCEVVTATDVALAALRGADLRLRHAGLLDRVLLMKRFTRPAMAGSRFRSHRVVGGRLLPAGGHPARGAGPRTASAGRQDCRRGALAAVADYPLPGDQANEIIGATKGLHLVGSYRDADVAIDVFDTTSAASVAARDGVPGAGEDWPGRHPSQGG